MILTPGQELTYWAEGTNEQCKYPHVPAWWKYNSGVTLNHGYDCRDKKPDKIMADLLRARVSQPIAYQFAQASGLKGRKAHKWLLEKGLDEFEMGPVQQMNLFSISYNEIEADAKRIYSKPGCRKAYGWILTWDNLIQPVRDIIIDLRFRGDWTPSTRRWLAAAVRSNNLRIFTEAISSWQYWRLRRRVPEDRFRRRKEFLNRQDYS